METARNEPSRHALLIIDMISDWRFPDADRLLSKAEEIAPRIADLKRSCRGIGAPVIYVNDHFGDWRRDFAGLVRVSLEGRGRAVTERLLPDPQDFFILKPRHSAFFATPLDLLLRQLDVCQVMATGIAGDQCILASVMDAKLRQLDVLVPAECIASQSEERNAAAIDLMSRSLQIRVESGPFRHADCAVRPSVGSGRANES
jgi:nicotinamidase-related amidase